MKPRTPNVEGMMVATARERQGDASGAAEARQRARVAL